MLFQVVYYLFLIILFLRLLFPIADIINPTLLEELFLPMRNFLLNSDFLSDRISIGGLGSLFEYLWFFPELFILLGVILLLSFALWGKLLSLSTLDVTHFARIFTLSVIFSASLLRLFIVISGYYFDFSVTVSFNGLLQVNFFLLCTKFVLILLRFLVLAVRSSLEVKQGASYEYFIFVLFGLFSSLVFVSSKNMLIFFISMEIQNLCWITLLGRGKGVLGTERAIKYFFVSALAGCFFIIGAYFLFIIFNSFSITSWSVGYRVLLRDNTFAFNGAVLGKSFYGTLDGGFKLTFSNVLFFLYTLLNVCANSCSDIVSASNTFSAGFELNFLLIAGVVFILFPILIKLGVFPFSYWIRDVYSGASFCTIGLLTYISKTAYLVVLLRFFCYFGQLSFDNLWAPILLFCLIGSLLYASIMSYLTQRIRAFLGLSGVVHLGFVFLGLFPWNQEYLLPSYGSGIFYYLTYILSSFVFYAILCNLEERRLNSGLLGLDYFSDFKGLLNVNFFMGRGILTICFVWVGIPPFLGFWSKVFVLWNIINIPVLFIVGVLAHVMSRVYYLRIVQLVAFDETEYRQNRKILGFDWNFSFIFVFFFLFLLLFGFFVIIKYNLSVLYDIDRFVYYYCRHFTL
jgi:NADH:ubiquinone oxidoreductase subunit 2 (subunit N)